MAGVADSSHGKTWCPRGNPTPAAIYGEVSKYLGAHPPHKGQDAATVVTAALAAAFPCGAK